MINWNMEVAVACFTTPHLFHRPLEGDKKREFAENTVRDKARI